MQRGDPVGTPTQSMFGYVLHVIMTIYPKYLHYTSKYEKYKIWNTNLVAVILQYIFLPDIANQVLANE